MIGVALGAVAIALTIAFAWFLKRDRPVYRNDLPRIYELRDSLPNPLAPNTYFRDLDNTLAAWPQKLKQFRDIESDLQGLDATAWTYLKAELTPLLTAKDETRGWQQLVDKLNQAKAYNYLASIGCTNIRFIPESKIRGQRTPDLEASAQGGHGVLCEVKTINVSENEANRLHDWSVGATTDQLPAAFFSKLARSVAQATAQMKAYSTDVTIRRIAYIIVNYDDRLHQCADRYQVQINQCMPNNPTPGVEVRFDIKEAYYNAKA